MKYILHYLAFVFAGMPAVVAGYLFATVITCFAYGVKKHAAHEDAAIIKFTKGNEHGIKT